MNCGAEPERCAAGAQRTNDELVQVLKDGRFWFFIIVVLLVALIGAFIVANSKDSFDELNKPTWMPPETVFTIIWVVLFFIIAYTCFRAVTESSGYYANAIYILFLLNMIFQVAWLFLFFKSQNFSGALIAMALVIITAILLFAVMWMINPFYSFIFLAYVVWLFIALSLNVQMNNLNPAPPTTTTDNTTESEESQHDLPSMQESCDSGEVAETVAETINTN